MIKGIPAEQGNRLNPEQWVNVWWIDGSGQCESYGTCQMKELNDLVADAPLEDFGLELCEAQP